MMTKITQLPDENDPPTAIFDYVYDLWGRRVAKLLDTDADSDYDEETHYLLDGERHERGHAGDHIVLTFNANEDLTYRYLHGPAVDQILADEQIDDVSGTTVAGDVLWPLTDNLGTVRDIADYNTGTSITTIGNHITYDAYGAITAETNATVTHAYAFTGRERDEETDLDYYRARYYDAGLGRFISQDPLGYSAGDSNYSRYSGNSPIGFSDPSGQTTLMFRPSRDYLDEALRKAEVRRREWLRAQIDALVRENAGTGHIVNVDVYHYLHYHQFGLGDGSLENVLWKVTEFYAQYGIVINWNIKAIRAKDPHFDTLWLDLDLNQTTESNLSIQDDIKWFKDKYADKPTVFLIDEIDLKGWTIGSEALGMAPGNFAFVADTVWAPVATTIAHELGHVLGLEHCSEHLYFNLMHANQIDTLDIVELSGWQIDDIIDSPHVDLIPKSKLKKL
jgi:RHS repeat-associated protein